MTFNQALRQARDELIADGKAVTPTDVVNRAMEINGAGDEFLAGVERRAFSAAVRQAKHLLGELDVEMDENDPQQALFAQLGGLPAPKALAIAQDNGIYAYRGFGFCTDDDLSAAEKVRAENVRRAQARLADLIAKHDQLAPYLTDPSVTVLDALGRMDPTTQEGP